jgi:hypothetical protein
VTGAAKTLVDQTGIAWRLARTRLAGLTDDEFFWEPVAGCWSLRRRSEMAAVPGDAAPGEWWIDGGDPAPDPPPFTTVAWLVAHMTLGTWNWNDIILGRPVAPEPSLPGHADGAVALWTDVVGRFERMVAGFSDDDLAGEVDAWGGRVARAFLVSHVVAEVLHHSAEVGRLRDLFRHRYR